MRWHLCKYPVLESKDQ
jgi:hypothetical protein